MHVRHIAMPDLVGNPFGSSIRAVSRSPVFIKEAELDPRRIRREQREVDPLASQVAPSGCGRPSRMRRLGVYTFHECGALISGERRMNARCAPTSLRSRRADAGNRGAEPGVGRRGLFALKPAIGCRPHSCRAARSSAPSMRRVVVLSLRARHLPSPSFGWPVAVALTTPVLFDWRPLNWLVNLLGGFWRAGAELDCSSRRRDDDHGLLPRTGRRCGRGVFITRARRTRAGSRSARWSP